MRGQLNWVSKTYNNMPMIITENGYSDHTGTLQDDDRIDQIKVRYGEKLYSNISLKRDIILEKLFILNTFRRFLKISKFLEFFEFF